MLLSHYQHLLKEHIAVVRRLEYYLQSEVFTRLYGLATEGDRCIVGMAIKAFDYASVTLWTQQQIKKHKLYEYLQVGDLRKTAKQRGIVDSNTLTKTQLIYALEDDDVATSTSLTR
jgi:hypothetical protein